MTLRAPEPLITYSSLDSRIDALESSTSVVDADITGATNAASDIQTALTAGAGQTVVIPEGIYKLDSVLTIPSNTVVTAYGATLRPTANQSAILFDSPTARTPTTTYQLTVDGVVGALTVTVSTSDSAHFAAGDYVTMRDASYTLGGEACRRETNIVESVNTGTGVITLQRPIGHAYASAGDAWIAKITPATNIHVFGAQIDMDAVAGGIAADCDAIYADWPVNCSVNDVTVYNQPDKAVDFHGGLDSHIRRCNSYSPDLFAAGEGYNMRLEYCRDCTIEGGESKNVRHHADIAGGQSCHVLGGVSSGRTGTSQCGAFLHGLESRWCSIKGFTAENMTDAVGAGNSTFGADFDFKILDFTANACDRGAFITTGCARFTLTGRAFSSTERGVVLDNSTEWTADVEVRDNASVADGSVSVSGVSSGKIKLKVRNPAYKGITVTQTAGAGRVDIDPDIDMASVAQPAIDATLLKDAAEVHVKGGLGARIKMSAASTNAIILDGPCDMVSVTGVEFTGAMLRCVYVNNAPKRIRIRRNLLSTSTASAEAMRIEAMGEASTSDVLSIIDNEFLMTAGSSTAIKLNGTVTSAQGNVADIHGNRFGTVTTRISNSGSVTLRGLVDVLTATVAWDPASLTTGSSERKSITVTGASVGDPVSVGLSTIAATGWDIQGAVIAANTVEAKLTNNTGGTIDLASGTLRATVWKHS